MTDRVRVRFAPSPTGALHIGGVRTALYNELMARRADGDFILRIEDTDRTRFVEGSMEGLCQSLEKLGIIPNEGVWIDKKGGVIQRGDFGPYIQSERTEKHLGYAQKLIETGKAYYCFCTQQRLEALREEQQANRQPTMYDGQCRALSPQEAAARVAKGEDHVIRLKLSKQGKVTIWDMIRDDIEFDWSVVDDQVIIKSDGMPTYHLASTCDDHDMEITHVLRGEEWVSSTPKHVFIYDAFGWTPPKFAHLPLLLNSDRSKLSKRQADVAAEDYLKNGYLPEALLNFVALLGWNPSGEQEVYTHNELVNTFDIAKVNKAGAVFNLEKLDWLNSQYVKAMPKDKYLELAHPYLAEWTDDGAFADRAALLVRDRVVKMPDVGPHAAFLFAKEYDFTGVKLSWKTQKPEEARERLEAVSHLLNDMSDEEVLNASTVETTVKKLIEDKKWGNGDTLWPLRVALSGSEKSPGPFELIAAYGKKRAADRIKRAIESL